MPPDRERAEERRVQIIEAALACFARQGYNNTTMDDIVAESGLSKGTLYWYFESKDDLFGAALLSAFEGFGRQTLIDLAQCETASDKLRAVAQAAAGLSEEFEGLFSLFLEFWASSPRREEAARIWMGLLDEYKETVVGIVEEGVQGGEFNPVDAESLVWALLAAYDALAVYVMLKPDLDVQCISDTFIETLLSGMKGNRRPEGGGSG